MPAMESFSNIQYYQARRNQILDILEEIEQPVMLKDLKVLYKEKFHADMPFSDISDTAVHDWLINLDNVGTDIRNNERFYFRQKPLEKILTSAPKNESKRKTSSPIVSHTVKRSRSAPENEDVPMPATFDHVPPVRQPRVVKFKDQPNQHKNNAKARSKSENRAPTKLTCAPNMYGSLLVGDDFFLGMAIYKLGFSASKIRGRLQSGFCVSGLTIQEATKSISEIEDDRHKTAIIYIGSIDIAAGKELIQIMQDLTDLMKACAEKNIRPVLCTLAPLPNYIQGNRKETVTSFNKFICHNPYGIPVIDINKCFRYGNTEEFAPRYFLESPRYVSGSKKLLILWSKDGRDRVYEMLMKNLGMALVATGNVTYSYI